MEVIPAIDLRDGKCVNLYQGDYDLETVYSEDPVEVATHWTSLGAARLHVVDLDGARAGVPKNLSIVEDLVSSVSARVQMGGGIRDVKTARAVLSLGLDRVAVGTAAVENPGLVQEMCDELGADSVVVSVDARDDYVAVEGWTQSTPTTAPDLVRRLSAMGARRFMYTAIVRTGTLTEPDFGGIVALASQSTAKLIVAGGISSVGHIARLADIGVEGAVVGKALYTGAIDLGEALGVAGPPNT